MEVIIAKAKIMSTFFLQKKRTCVILALMKRDLPTDFCGKVKLLVERCDGNQSEAARRLGVSSVYVHEITTNKKKVLYPRPQTLEALNRALGIKTTIYKPLPIGFRVVRVYGLTHAAEHKNIPCDIPPAVHDTELPTIIYLTNSTHRLVAFKVEGESMCPTLRDSMHAICDCDLPPSEIRNGNIVVAKFDDKAVIKRYRRDGDNIVLTSDNPDGDVFCVHSSDIQWMIRAIGVMGDL